MSKILKSKVFLLGLIFVVILAIGTLFIYKNKGNKKESVANNNEIVSSNIDKKQIYGTFEGSSSWAVDPKDPKELLKTSKNGSVVKVKIESIEEAIFFEKTKDFSSLRPFTPIKVNFKNKLHGKNIKDIDTIYLRGGDVKISEMIKTIDSDSVEKMGLDKLTEKEKNDMYVSYTTDYDYKLKVGEEYTLILMELPNGAYVIDANGYGIFKEDNTSLAKSNSTEKKSKKKFKNVLTGRELIDENGATIALEE